MCKLAEYQNEEVGQVIKAVCTVAVVLAATASSSSAQVVTDRSFFDPLPSTTIDFETRGDGTRIQLGAGDSEFLPSGEYAAWGVTFGTDIQWVNDGGVDFDAAQAIGGSPEIAIPGSSDSFTMFFDVPVRAFGFWVVNNRTFSTDPQFEAFDASGASLGIAVFNEDLIDGVIGVAEYGFMGIASPDTPIASVRILKDATSLDDLIYSSVPTPTSTSVIALGILAVTRRRR